MKFGRFLVAASALASILLSTGCATIVHSGPRSIPVASTPTGATVTIYDRDGQQVSKQTTPFTAVLRTKYGYFKGQDYKLVFELPGYQKTEVQLNSELSAWYLGNIVFGGLIGMLIVDPLTGAMFNLSPEKIEQSLPADQKTAVLSGQAILVVMKDQATAGELAAMQPVK